MLFVDDTEEEEEDLFGESWFEDDSDLIEVDNNLSVNNRTPPNSRKPKALTPGN